MTSTRPNSNLIAPDDLAERDQLVLWRCEISDGRKTKVPYFVRGHQASSTNPRHWSHFESALKTLHGHPERYAGLGFVFSREDRFEGINLGYSLEVDGTPKPWARSTVERFADTYIEISPSGRSLKIWAKGCLPASVPCVRVGNGQIEMYDRSRYFTVTGRAFRGAPLEVEDHTADVLLLYERLVGQKTKRWTLQPLQGGWIPYGQQHNTIVSLAGTLRARNLCDEAIEACLQIVNERQCERPGPRAHISQIVRSSRKWGATA